MSLKRLTRRWAGLQRCTKMECSGRTRLAWPTTDPASASGQENEIQDFFTETLRSIEQRIIQFQQQLSDS